MANTLSKMIAIGRAGAEIVYLNLRLFLRTRMLITANAGGGKSYFLRLLAEVLFPHVQVIIIDPEGEYFTLRERFGYALIAHMKGNDAIPDVATAGLLAHRLLEHKISAICDLSELKAPVRHQWIRVFLEALMEVPRHMRRRVVIIVDEAHLYCPEKGQGESEAQSAMLDITTRGRKRGYTAVFASQRHAKVSKSATAELLNRMVGPTFEGGDIDRAITDLSIAKDERHGFAEQLKVLEEGNFNCIGRAISKKRILFKVNPVKTTHPDPDDLDKEQMTEPPPPPQKVRALLAKLADLPKEAEKKAKTEADLKKEILDLKRQVAMGNTALAIEKKRLAVPAPSPRPLPAAPPPPPQTKIEIKKVDVPVVAPAAVKRLESALDRAEKLYEKLKVFGKPVDDAAKELRSAITTVLAVDSAAILEYKSRKLGMKHGPAAAPPKPVPAPVHRPAPVARPAPAPKPLKPPPKTEYGALPPVPGDGSDPQEGPLSARQNCILTSLLQFESIGIGEVPREWLTGWMGIKVTGTFKNNLGGLRSRAYVDYVENKVKLTEAGRAVAVPSEEEISTEGLLKHCLEAVNGRQKEIITYLHGRHPNWVTREELVEAMGIKITGTFKNNLGGVHSAGMVEYGSAENKGSVKCPDWMFVNAMA